VIEKNFILVVVLVLISNNVFVFASDIRILTHSLSGQTYVDENGELRGEKHAGKRAFNLELVREMMIILKHRKDITKIPLKRGLIMIQKDINIGLFNVSKTPERENIFKWVGPLQIEVDYFDEMKNAPTGIKLPKNISWLFRGLPVVTQVFLRPKSNLQAGSSMGRAFCTTGEQNQPYRE
jgi:hypothetical protein